MGFLDNLRDRIGGGFGGDDYDDDYYDDEYDDGDYDDEPRGTGLLGNTYRPEAESVSVYTRSGRPVKSNPTPAPSESAPRRSSGGSASRSSSYSSRRSTRDDYDDGYDDYDSSESYSRSKAPTFNASGQLPPYVLRAVAYDDVQTVVRRVRTNQPVFLVLDETPAEDAQRILDFCFGLSFGVGGEVQPVGDRSFLVVPAGIMVSDAEIDRLLSEVM